MIGIIKARYTSEDSIVTGQGVKAIGLKPRLEETISTGLDVSIRVNRGYDPTLDDSNASAHF